MHDELAERRHAIRHAGSAPVDEPHVPFCEQSGEPFLLVHHDERADARARHQRSGFVERGARRDAPRIGDDAVLRALDDPDLTDLRLDLARPEPPVDDADASLFRLDDRHRRARDGVHVRRDDRPLQRDAARQARGQVDEGGIAPLEHTALRREDEVVERAAAHLLEHPAADGRVDGWKGGHGFILQGDGGSVLDSSFLVLRSFSFFVRSRSVLVLRFSFGGGTTNQDRETTNATKADEPRTTNDERERRT